MATANFTESPALDRNAANKANPFIGCFGYSETIESVSAGLAALGFAIGSTEVQGQCGRECYGLQLFADALRAALVFETANKGGAQ